MNVKRIAIFMAFILLSAIPINATYSYETTGNANFIGDGKTLYVGGSGPDNYTSIQDAINDASDGDTIFVYSGIYYENIVIDKSIKLIGEDAETTIIDGMRKNDTVIIIANNVFISRFTIKNGSEGIHVNSRPYTMDLERITIKNNIIVDNADEGISLWWSNHCIIYGNTVSNDTWGICLYGSYFNIIINNNLMKNEENVHVYYWKNWILFWTNRFIRNYWDNWHLPIPKPIIAFFYPLYPLIQFDFLPRLFPYRW